MTFKQKYDECDNWRGKVTVMEIYYLAMSQKVKGWTIAQTAEHFDCSIGLVSENLRLAQAIHTDAKILNCESRQMALKRLNRR
jgi:hypothetical protein